MPDNFLKTNHKSNRRMTEEEIKSYIERLNSKNARESIFLRQISHNVEVARVWEKEPILDNNLTIGTPSYKFFFIKNPAGKYVGAVLDMYRDLHVYVLEEERKKGFLSNALRESILPYLFYNEDTEREVQRITLTHGNGKLNYKNSRKVAERLGFKPIDETELIFELEREKFDWKYENLNETNGHISKERSIELRKRVIYAYRQLYKISDELLMAYGTDRQLSQIANEVSYFNSKIEDLEMIHNKKNRG